MKKFKITVLFITSMFLSLIVSDDLNAQSSVTFKIRNMGINVDGFFKNTTINSDFSSEDITQWTLSGSVDVNSINTDNEKRDIHLLEDDYFDAKRYPKIKIEAANFKKTVESNYEVTIKVTIKETTKIFKVKMLITNDNSGLTLKTYFEIDRRDFDVGGSSFVMSDTVKINVNHIVKKQ